MISCVKLFLIFFEKLKVYMLYVRRIVEHVSLL